MGLVSVLIALNRIDSYTVGAINSILNQTYVDLEVLIIVNGVNHIDVSEQISQRFRDARVRIISTPVPQLAYALNLGLSECSSDIVARMDADDIAHPNRIEMQLKYMNEHCLDVVGSSARLIDQEGQEIGLWRPPIGGRRIARWLNYRNAFIHPSVLFRKEVVMKARGYNAGLNSEDYDLWLRLKRLSVRWDNLSSVLMDYRVHSNSSQRKLNAYAECAGYALREFILDKNPLSFFAIFYWCAKAIVRGV